MTSVIGQRTVRRFDIVGWSAALVVAFLAGTAVADLEWPLHASVTALGGVAMAAFGVAMARGASSIDVFCASILPISAFSGILRDVSLGPITVLGAWTGVCVAVAGVLWLMSPRQVWSAALWPFVLLVSLGVTSTVWFPLTQRGLQNLLVLLAFILTALLTASHISGSTTLIGAISTAFALASWIPVVVYGLSLALWGLGNKVLVGPRGLALFALVALAWNLPQWRYGKRSALAPIVAIFVIIVTSLSRLAIVVGLVLLPLSRIDPRRRMGGWMRVILFTGVSIGLFYGAYNYITPLRERFIEEDLATFGGGITINVSGRDDLWSTTWHSYQRSPWFGNGVGSAEALISTHPAFRVAQPHNEYLRILHDFGLTGLLFWLWGFCTLLRRTWRAWRRSDSLQEEEAGLHLAAFLLLVALGLAMITDNVVSYVHVMAPLGVLIGCSLGLSLSRGQEELPGGVTAPMQQIGSR